MISTFNTIFMCLCFFVFNFYFNTLPAQAPENDQGYHFETLELLKSTSVKDQYRTNTCWSFSGISMLESELMRLGKGEYNLSEMFIVRHAFEDKAKKYVRMHGTINFAGGGIFIDATDVIREHGIVPEEVYTGLKPGEEKHDHIELDHRLKEFLDEIIKNDGPETSRDWFEEFCSLLDENLGNIPDTFTYQDKLYTPVSFARELGLSMDDYILITSFNHHPFYKKFILEVPDNWSWTALYNVKLDELTDIIDYSLEHGYTIGWAADVSEKGFSRNRGLALVPEIDFMKGTSTSKGADSSHSGGQESNEINCFKYPVKEMNITQELRQLAFDDYSTTDDHGMHITGMVKDQGGKIYYLVKNSWGAESGPYNGYFYASRAYVKYKTTMIMVNKHALPTYITEKLNL